jgi:hypothetical protein
MLQNETGPPGMPRHCVAAEIIIETRAKRWNIKIDDFPNYCLQYSLILRQSKVYTATNVASVGIQKVFWTLLTQHKFPVKAESRITIPVGAIASEV